MQGIGDYIHLFESNYFEYGTKRYATMTSKKEKSNGGTTTAPGFAAALDENHKNLYTQIQSREKAIDRQRMESVLTSYLYGIGENDFDKTPVVFGGMDQKNQDGLMEALIEITKAMMTGQEEVKNRKYIDSNVATNILTKYTTGIFSTPKLSKNLNTRLISETRLEATIKNIELALAEIQK